ncbi:MAG: chromate transporter, partial [Mycobacterium sp.]|nr:chromate transporter [Mycobacterium sp.]
RRQRRHFHPDLPRRSGAGALVPAPPRQPADPCLRQRATAAAAGALSGAVVVLTRQAITDWITATIGLTTLALLWRFKVPEPYTVIGAGMLGILLH